MMSNKTFLSIVFLLTCACHILATVNGLPLGNGKQVTFSSAMTIDYENIRYSENEPDMGTPEYYESFRWVAVSSEGMEYEGTLEEVMNYMDPISEEDTGEQDPSAQPANPHMAGTEYDPSANPRHDNEGFQMLAKAMDHLQVMTAEKRSVFGDDDRTRVTNVNTFPYTAIGRIDSGCTGTFINRRAVLTAGHCVHNGKWISGLNIRRSKDCNPDKGYRHTWRWAIAFCGWTQRRLRTHDIALIIVAQPSPVFMDFRSVDILGGTVNIAGYPGDKPDGCMWQSSCTLTKVEGNKLFYPCDTNNGMSGSAVYQFFSSINTSLRVIRGVHVGSLPDSNVGVRISSYYESQFRKWISKYRGN